MVGSGRCRRGSHEQKVCGGHVVQGCLVFDVMIHFPCFAQIIIDFVVYDADEYISGYSFDYISLLLRLIMKKDCNEIHLLIIKGLRTRCSKRISFVRPFQQGLLNPLRFWASSASPVADMLDLHHLFVVVQSFQVHRDILCQQHVMLSPSKVESVSTK